MKRIRSSSKLTEEDLARLHASYLERNKMEISWVLLVRVLATLVIGTIACATVMALVAPVFSGFLTPGVWKVVSIAIMVSFAVFLMNWVYGWDDHRRFEAFVAKQESERDDVGQSVTRPKSK